MKKIHKKKNKVSVNLFTVNSSVVTHCYRRHVHSQNSLLQSADEKKKKKIGEKKHRMSMMYIVLCINIKNNINDKMSTYNVDNIQKIYKRYSITFLVLLDS